MDKMKLNISACLKIWNKIYFCNITMQMIADKVGVSRETLSRLTTDSAFSLLYNVCSAVYELYYDNTVSFKKDYEFFEFGKMITNLVCNNYFFIA